MKSAAGKGGKPKIAGHYLQGKKKATPEAAKKRS